MIWFVVLASGVLAAVAAAGVLGPFARARQPGSGRLADPLEDERMSLMRGLRDLDEELGRGDLTEDSYEHLRAETEVRAVAVLRALEARRDSAGDTSPVAPGGRPRRLAATVLVAAAVVAGAVPLLASAIRERAPGRPITGGANAATAPLGFFEQRVREHPDDLAARLDLARRYLQTGAVRAATEQFVAALDLDPQNSEARASLGFLLYLSGAAQEGLDAVEQALEADPEYPEALYFKGVILLRGLDGPAEAARAFRAYLEAAPFGSHRAEVEGMLDEAEGAA